MPSTRAERLRTLVHASAPWRKLMPGRTVRRHVQGVDLYLPWSHLLPDYARSRPSYGQNLVDLAGLLAAEGSAGSPTLAGETPGTSPLQVLDIGANIGDSAAQIVKRTDARVLCVEGDPYWVRYLRLNLGDSDATSIEAVLLTADTNAEGADAAVTSVRNGGTTTFVPSAVETGAMPRMSVSDLRRAHPEFDRVRLVKSDTDGHDVALVPAVAEAWAASTPVLFFEFDPILTRRAGNEAPNAVWLELADLGYADVGIWDNGGDPLGRLPISEVAAAATSLEPRPLHLGYYFWDVAVVHGSDQVAREALTTVLPEPYDVRGILR